MQRRKREIERERETEKQTHVDTHRAEMKMGRERLRDATIRPLGFSGDQEGYQLALAQFFHLLFAY